MQTYIIDMDIISGLSYEGRWFERYVDLKEEIAKKGEYPLKMNFADQFTTILTNKDRIYSFTGN